MAMVLYRVVVMIGRASIRRSVIVANDAATLKSRSGDIAVSVHSVKVDTDRATDDAVVPGEVLTEISLSRVGDIAARVSCDRINLSNRRVLVRKWTMQGV